MPAPSVAVKIPATMPPTTTMMRRRAGIASRMVFPACAALTAPEVGYFLRIAYTSATAITVRPMRMPGTAPAMNSAAIDVPPAIIEYTMKAVVGGISRPEGADAMFAAAVKAGS